MLLKANILWIIGLLTLVPYSIYYLLFLATRDEYALWITLPLFWVFGYWSIVGPLLALLKVRSVIKAIQMARSAEELRATLASADAQDAAIEFIATENRIPRFLAARIYKELVKRLGESS